MVGTDLQEITLGNGFLYIGVPLISGTNIVAGEIYTEHMSKKGFTLRDLESYYKGDVKPLCAIKGLYKDFYNGKKYKNSYYNLLDDKYNLGNKGFLKAHEEYLQNLKGYKNFYCNHKKFCSVRRVVNFFPGKQLYREKRRRVLLTYKRGL